MRQVTLDTPPPLRKRFTFNVRARSIQALQNWCSLSKIDSIELESSIFMTCLGIESKYEEILKRILYNVHAYGMPISVPIHEIPCLSDLSYRVESRVDDWRNSEQHYNQRQLELLSDSSAVVSEEDGVSTIRCHRCKSSDVQIEQKQTRSADEGSTVFVTCNTCRLRWRM